MARFYSTEFRMSRLTKTDHGNITYTATGTDKVTVALPTKQCVHCGGHFVAKPPKIATALTPYQAQLLIKQGKTLRGWCMNCNGPICGPGCMTCVPEDQMLTNLEKGMAADFKPIRVFT